MNRAAAIVFVSLTALGAAAVLPGAALRLPGDRRGYEPEQPVPYSHRVHAGEMRIDCLYCHFAAETSRRAGVPPASVCMNCHRTVTAGGDAIATERAAAAKDSRPPRVVVSDRLRPLYEATGFDPDTGRTDPSRAAGPIRWLRVHDLPDHVWFDHSVHVTRGVACQACHGPVETMERVRQVAPLTMGWCIECHRANARDGGVSIPPVPARAEPHVTTDCAACHT